MKNAVDLLAALADGPSTDDARALASTLRQAGAATPEVADAIARAHPPPVPPSLAWRIATFTVIAGAGLATARAVWFMNQAPGVTPIVMWWVPLVVTAPAAIVALAAIPQQRAEMRRAHVQLAARHGLELLARGVPHDVVIDVVVFIYGLEAKARRTLEHPPSASASPSAPAEHRAATVLAMNAHQAGPTQRTGLLTAFAAILVLVGFLLFFTVYFQVINGGMRPLIDPTAASGPPNRP